MFLKLLEDSTKKWIGKTLGGAADIYESLKKRIPKPKPNPPKPNNPPKVSDSKSKSNNKPVSKCTLDKA